MSVQRRKYDSDFKRNAVRLTENPDRTVKEVAANLGISKDLLYKWRRELRLKEGLAFPGHGKEAPPSVRIVVVLLIWYSN